MPAFLHRARTARRPVAGGPLPGAQGRGGPDGSGDAARAVRLAAAAYRASDRRPGSVGGEAVAA